MEDEERAFFTNVLTVITIIAGLVTLIASLVIGTNASLNGGSPPTQTQVLLTCYGNHAITQYILAFVGLLLLACILRYVSSLRWKKIKKAFKSKNCVLILAWIILIIAIAYGLWLISIYTCAI
jgi:uncharacterized membrane protein